jgi:hypothetical protein
LLEIMMHIFGSFATKKTSRCEMSFEEYMFALKGGGWY